MIRAMPHAPTAASTRVVRFEVRAKPGRPAPKAQAVLARAAEAGFHPQEVRTAEVYLIEADMAPGQCDAIQARVLADAVTEGAVQGAMPVGAGWACVEVHPLPGVMDPAAQSVREAVRTLLGIDAQVSTGVRYDFRGLSNDGARRLAERLLANPVIHQITTGPFEPTQLPHGHAYAMRLANVPIRDLSDDQLMKMSREAHLFLSLDEMLAVRDEFRRLGREPTDIELETIAQTWSEHCVHKTLKSNVRYRESSVAADSDGQGRVSWIGRPGHTVNPDGSVSIRNLLKSTVAAATFELIADGVAWPLSVFKDNSGVVEFDETFAVNIKVETHNRPSAIEPYGGAATGAGGCIRDVIGTGLGAQPIANTDVFCVAYPGRWEQGEPRTANPAPHEGQRPTLPPGVLPPRRILTDIVAGVKDYGNRMGIPTVNGALYFDDRYVGNPLVFCGCVGLLPRHLIQGQARPGDRIIALGGRTGRDGIHGATFSSAQIEQGHSTEFAHAVQIGNAIEEKRLLDAILRARDARGGPLYSGLTDCGAGGFSSAIGEMGGEIGAFVELERAPLKYAGLSYTEIWISEAQERMILAVPPANVGALTQICNDEGVELADLGHFGTPGAQLVLNYAETEVGRLSMRFLHEGIPSPTREASWDTQIAEPRSAPTTRDLPRVEPHRGSSASPRPPSVLSSLLAVLSHPTVASKHWLVRVYDHEVQGNTVVKPLAGPREVGPSDASVLCPVPGSSRGIAIACGLAPGIGDPAIGGDPYQMALAGIDEAVRNLVCVGADPSRIAILDNFCWPSCDKPRNMGALVRACAGCYDGAKAYRTPFVSGKDSLNNQLRYTDPETGQPCVIEIPYTLLITGLGIVPDARRCVTMDAKRAGNVLVLVGPTQGRLGGSIADQIATVGSEALRAPIPSVDLARGPATARIVADLIAHGLVQSAHDVSDGGVLTTVAEMLIATAPRPDDVARDIRPLGAELMVKAGDAALGTLSPWNWAFCESPSRYLLEVREGDLPRVLGAILETARLPCAVPIARLNDSGRLRWRGGELDESVESLRDAWMAPLDW